MIEKPNPSLPAGVERTAKSISASSANVYPNPFNPSIAWARPIRALAHQLQERTDGGTSRPLRRRLHALVGELGKDHRSFDPGIVPKTGTTLVRQWRGQAHTVVVCDDGFEYEGQRYRSLTVIAEQITGAHCSGPRFFGVTRRARASLPEASR